MLEIRKNIDTPTLIVIVVTLVLFVLALFATGFTHDLLLEAAVFLVSVKLILLSYRSAAHAHSVEQKLDRIYSELLHAETMLTEGEPGAPKIA